MTDDDRMPPPLIRAALSTGLVPTPYLWGDPASTPRRQWLYKPSYIRQFVSALFATTGAGKSSLVLVEAMAMACGKALLGVTPEQQLKVWYWNGEDPPDELLRRARAVQKHYHLRREDVDGWLFIDSGRVLPIIMADQVRFATRIATPLVEQMIVALLTNQIDVLIVDPFVSSHRVSENDNSAIEMVAKTWAEIAARANCSILLVHHTITQGRAMVMPPMSILAAAPRHWRRPQGRSGWSTS